VLEGHWYCSPECLEAALGDLLEALVAAADREPALTHRVPLGLLMLSQGLVSHDQLKEALKAQRASGGGRIGDWLRHLGAATEEQITRALGMQWSLPVFPLGTSRNYVECAELVPLPLLEQARMLPAHFISRSRYLYVAFADRIDYTTLCALEKMLDCRTEPCLAPQTAIEQALSELRRRPRPAELVFDSVMNHNEIARAVCHHASSLAAEEIRAAACANRIWIQIAVPSGTTHLLFRMPNTSQRASTRLDARA